MINFTMLKPGAVSFVIFAENFSVAPKIHLLVEVIWELPVLKLLEHSCCLQRGKSNFDLSQEQSSNKGVLNASSRHLPETFLNKGYSRLL